MCLFALVLMLQGAAVGVISLRGPAHTHLAATEPSLEDFRRWKAPSIPGAAGNLFGRTGHSHGSELAQRHHHAWDDASVVRTGEDATDGDGAAGEATALMAVLGPLPDGVGWVSNPTSQRPACGPAWALVTGFCSRIERPPQIA